MNKFILLLLLFIYCGIASAQTVEEKVLFTLDLKGDVDLYNFVYDEKSGNYCYVYAMPDLKKNFIISPKGESEKYDYIMLPDIKFDSKGNYFAAAGNYTDDYGINNNFLIVNGKTIKGLEYIESFSSYINKKDEFVFTFKIKDDFYIGYVKGDGSFRQSEKYDYVKPMYIYINERNMEGDGEYIGEEYFYKNEKGERGNIIIKNGKAGMIFEENIIMTDYSDIHESSLTFNKNNKPSFIAKNGGRFYEKAGNEFVVSGGVKYSDFDYVNPPVLFNSGNEPVYKASDSLEQYEQNIYLVKGNEKMPIRFEESENSINKHLFHQIYDLNISDDGNITYFISEDEIIPADPTVVNSYDKYYTKTYFVKNGKALKLGYNIGKIIYDAYGNMVFSGVEDLKKMEYLLLQSNGESIIVIGQGDFDLIADYGFLKNGDYFYFGQKFSNEENGSKGYVRYYNLSKLISEFDDVSYQYITDGAQMIQFSPDGNGFAISADENNGMGDYLNYIYTEKGIMNFPNNTVTGNGKFLNILNMFYTTDGRLFYSATTEMDTTDYSYTEEIFTDDKSLEKFYKIILYLKYNKMNNSVNFLASRKNKIYSVTVKF